MKVSLCGKKACCPSIEKIDDMIVITDDNQRITFTSEQWGILKEKIYSGEF